MNEYRVKVTVRNNLLLSAIESAGYTSQSEFAKACNIQPTAVSNLVSFRVLPISADGEFIVSAKAIMEVLGAAPSDLWTDKQLMTKLQRNTGEKAVSEHYIHDILENHIEMMTLSSPEDDYFNAEKETVVDAALATLTQMESNIIKQRFFEDKSLHEIGELHNITIERVRQIEHKALRKLRNPNRSDQLLDYVVGI